MSALRIHLLGTLQLVRDGRSLPPFPTQKSRSLFAFLALNRGRLLPREVLAGTFWGDRPEAVARKCLRTDLWRVRGVVEAGPDAEGSCLRVVGDEVGFASGEPHWLDVDEFERCVQAAGGRSGSDLSEAEAAYLDQAVRLYRGDLLEGVYDNWCASERDRLRRMLLGALERLMHFHEAREKWDEAVALGHRLLAADPLREQVHRDLMRCYVQQGNRAAALRQFAHCEQLIRTELDVEPMEETQALHERIRSGARLARVPRPAAAAFPPLRMIPGPVPPLLDQVESILADLYAATRHLEETRDRLASDSPPDRRSIA